MHISFDRSRSSINGDNIACSFLEQRRSVNSNLNKQEHNSIISPKRDRIQDKSNIVTFLLLIINIKQKL